MCDRPWAEVYAGFRAAGQKPSVEEILAHQDEIAAMFERWHEAGPLWPGFVQADGQADGSGAVPLA